MLPIFFLGCHITAIFFKAILILFFPTFYLDRRQEKETAGHI